MSPEQAEGRELTPAIDVFSLGAVLVQACTGRSLFAGTSTPQTLYNVVHIEPDLTPLPDELRGLVARCLAKDPSQRPTPTEIPQLLGRPAPSARPWPAAVHALIDEQHAEITRVLGLLEDGGVLVESGAETVVRTAPGAGGTAPPPGGLAPQDLGVPPVFGAADELTETALPAAGASAGPVPPAGAAAASDGPLEDPAGRRRPSRRVLLLGALGAGAAAAVAVPLTLDRLSGSSVAGASGASPSRTTSPSETVSPSASRSPSSSPEQASRFTLSDKWDTMLTATDFSRDGKFIAVGDLDGGVVLRHSPTLEIAAVLSGPGGTGVDNTTFDLVFSPDGSLLASVDKYVTITLWDVASRKKAATLDGDKNQKEPEYATLAFSPDGKILAHSANTTITLWDVRSRNLVATLVDPAGPTARVTEGAVLCMRFTWDSRTLIASTYTDKLRFWDIRRRRVTATVQKAGYGLIDLAVSPDGKVLAATSRNEVKLWRPGSRTEIEILTFTQEPISAVAFSPDGKSLTASEGGGAVQVWSTTTWNPIRVLDERIEEAAKAMNEAEARQTLPDALSFSPGGDLLAEALGYHLALWKLS
ncbi:protein kinase domain-containing protein [Streptomyces inhibens]|uniref:protein kinase domain-containing protein n=1 Tax=Streptomyces inhibens TaxID=2293571 RepID=UPI003159A5D0